MATSGQADISKRVDARTRGLLPTKRKSGWAPDDSRFDRIAEKRQQILVAAQRVFLDEGFAAASMEKIALAAGASKMTLYRHFKDKEALFVATIDEQFMPIAGTVARMSSRNAAEVKEALSSFGEGFVAYVTKPDVLRLYRMLLGELSRFPNLGKRFYENGPALAVQVIEQILRTVIPDDEASLRAREFLHLLMGDVYQRLLLGIPVGPKPSRDFAVQIARASDIALRPVGKTRGAGDDGATTP